MKLVNYISICGIALGLLSACDSDLEKVTYDQDAVKPAVLQEIAASYTLAAEKAEETAITFQWSKPEVGYQAAVANSIEIALAGTEFEKTAVLASSNNNEKTNITVLTLNRTILKLLSNVMPAEPVDVEIRIVSSISDAASPFISNVVRTKVTPYSMEKEYPFLAVCGGYCGWGFGESQRVYSKNENDDYEGMIFFGQGKAVGGWKLAVAGDWNKGEWGYSTGADEAETILLVASGGGNISSYSKTSYYMKINNKTGSLQMTKGHASWGIQVKGTASDTELTLSTSTANSIVTHALTATVNLKAGDTWRIRPDNAETDAVKPADVEHAISVEGDFFKVEEDGEYIVTWIFNKVTPKLSIKKQ